MKKDKESTARIVVRRQFNVTHSYTLEASFFGCDFGPHCGQHFSVDVSSQVTSAFNSHALMHFSALSGNRSQIFRRDHALVEPRPCMDRRIFRVFEKSVRAVSCHVCEFSIASNILQLFR